MPIYRIRVTGDVLETASATRRATLDGELITFSREPVYIDADELPADLTTDPHLRIDTIEVAPAGIHVIQKKRRPRPDELDNLRSERVQNPQSRKRN